MPERLPVTLKHLVALEFKGIEFKNLFEVRVWFSILRSSPNLERLVLSVSCANFFYIHKRKLIVLNMSFLKNREQKTAYLMHVAGSF